MGDAPDIEYEENELEKVLIRLKNKYLKHMKKQGDTTCCKYKLKYHSLSHNNSNLYTIESPLSVN